MGWTRVLINALHAKTGGGITYLRNIVPELAETGEFELHLFLHRDQFDLLGPVDERVRVHLFDFPSGILHLLAWEQLALPILARIMGADVTLSPANFGPLAAPGAVIMLRNSLAVVGRETRISKRIYWATLAIMTALSLLASRRAIAVSQYARRALTFGVGGVLAGKVAVINHGVNPFFSPPQLAEERERFLLVVADLYIQKNLHTLIAAMRGVASRFPDVTLKIAGSAVDPEYGRELRRLIATHQLEERVFLLGSVDVSTLRDLYRRCQMLVFPSTVETFGNPIIEAMACGAPVACSNRAAMPEIAGDAASYFDPLDLKSMEATICHMIADRQLREDLSRKGQGRAREFSWRRTALSTAALLRDVAGGSMAP